MASSSLFLELEELRKNHLSWFSYFPRDVIQLISQLVRPIDRFVQWWPRIRRDISVDFLTIDGKVVTSTMDSTWKFVTNYFTLPDFQPTTPSPRAYDRVQKIGPDQQSIRLVHLPMLFSPEWEINALILDQVSYLFKESPEGLSLIKSTDRCSGPVEVPGQIEVSSEGMLYLTFNNSIYQLNLLTIASSQTLTRIYHFKSEGKTIVRLLRVVPGGLLVETLSSLFFFDVMTQQITRTFDIPDFESVVMDPVLQVFYFKTSTQLLQITADDKVIVKADQLPSSVSLSLTTTGYLVARCSRSVSLYY